MGGACVLREKEPKRPLIDVWPIFELTCDLPKAMSVAWPYI